MNSRKKGFNAGWAVVLGILLAFILSPLPLLADDDLEIEGAIEVLGPDYLEVAGNTIFVDDDTEIEGPNGDINFSDLMVGHYVEVEAGLQADGSWLAEEIELEEDVDAEGVIQAKGSDNITVRGAIFFVDNQTEIRGPHGSHLTFADLQVGDNVEVEADLLPDNSYLADKIELDDDAMEIEVEGHITALGSETLEVAGFLFYVNSNTRIRDDDGNPISFSELQIGDEVEVKGIARNNGDYLALRIELDDDERNEIELKAPVDSLFADGLVVAGVTFLVDSNTVILDDDRNPITFGDLQVGMLVEVRGETRSDGSIRATRIKVEDFFHDELELTGHIESLGNDFLVVLGVTFLVDSNTVVLDDDNQPISFGDLVAGQLVEVRGNLQPNGDWLADRIKIEDDGTDELEIRAIIDSLGASSIFAAGNEFLVNENTLILDHSNNPVTFADLSVGLIVEIKAQIQPNGDLVAVRVKIEDSLNFGKMSGTVISVNAGSIVVEQPEFQLSTGTVVLNENYQPVGLNELQAGQQVTIWSDGLPGTQAQALQIKINSGGVTGISNPSRGNRPVSFELKANYPNPFNPTTTIPLAVKGAEWRQVTLAVYNVLGQEVRTLFSGQLNGGSYEFSWNGLDNRGNQVVSGVYLYRVTEQSGQTAVRKMILLK